MTVRKLLVTLVLVALTASACGIPVDSEPEVISNDQLPDALRPGSSTTTTLPDQLTEEVTIFLVDPGDGVPTLRPVIRQVPVVESGAELEFLVLEQLLIGPTNEEQIDGNLISVIVPAGDEPITVLGLDRAVEGQLTVVLSEPPDTEGENRSVAFAQMVFTLTEMEGIESVRFLARNVDGADEDVSVSTDTDEGDVTRPVSREDYSSLRPAGFTN